MLKNELLMLKCKCLEHSSCNCEAIRNYLSASVNTMPLVNATLYSQLDNRKPADDIANEIAREQSSASAINIEHMALLGAMMTPATSMEETMLVPTS
jgi:hypothetical protein